MRKIGLTILLALALMASFAQTEPTAFEATYAFPGISGQVQFQHYGGTAYDGITMGPLRKVGVITQMPTNSFAASDWPLGANADMGKYIGFTITAVPGYEFSINTITFGICRNSEGTRYTEWRGSADNFGAAINGYGNNFATGLTNNEGVLENPDENTRWPGNILTLSNVNEYQNILECGFRMYMYGAETANGTAGLWESITISGTYKPTANPPVFSVTPTSLSGFSYMVGQGPSTSKSFDITAENLVPGGYVQLWGGVFEISTDDVNYYYALQLPLSENGGLQQTVYVRLESGIPLGNYDESITVKLHNSTPGYNVIYVDCSGSVVPTRYLIDFEGAGEVKTDYDYGTVYLGGRLWGMTDVLIETDTNYVIEGARSANLKGSGTSAMTMLEDKPNGAGEVKFQYCSYGNDDQTSWIVEYSIDQGESWTQAGTSFTPEAAVNTFSAEINTSRSVRICIKEATGSGTSVRRALIDNIEIADYYDFYDRVPKMVTENECGIMIIGGNANISIINRPGTAPDLSYESLYHECLTLLGDGPWSVDTGIRLGGQEVKGDNCRAAVKYDNIWYGADIIDGFASFDVPEANPGPNRELEVFIGRRKAPTTPVTLSHFSATMTAENYVNLKWISQTETGLMGYNVLRSAEEDLSSASQICAMIAATNSSEAHAYSYLDKDLVEDGTYYYWLQSVEMDGTTNFHGPASVIFSITGDSGSPSIPKVTKLEDAYPNPFNPNTTIRYQLEAAGKVKIDIYNTRGQIVRSFSQSHDAAGYYSILWDGCDSNGRALASGVYLYRMTSGKYSASKKMVLQK